MIYDSQSLKLTDLRFYSYHGVKPQERLIGAYYTVNLEMFANLGKAVESDDIADTINYAEASRIIREEMNQSSNLLENVAGRIIKRLFKTFPSLESVTISVAKEHPPVTGECANASVEIQASREPAVINL